MIGYENLTILNKIVFIESIKNFFIETVLSRYLIE